MSAQAYVDESGRRSSYHVCAAVIANGDVTDLRRTVRSFCLPGQRRWHFTHERPSRRQQIIDALIQTGQITALIYHGTGHDVTIRSESLERMVRPLLQYNVNRLIIESRQGRDHRDRQVLIEQLRHTGAAIAYEHMPPHHEPLLWVADALAWCSSAGGTWRRRIDPLVAIDQNITDP